MLIKQHILAPDARNPSLRTKAVVIRCVLNTFMFVNGTGTHYAVRQIASYQVNNRQIAPTEEIRNTLSCLH